MAESDPPKPVHPLDGADLKDCYDIMMHERSILIAAKRDSEDTLVKSVVQLSVALITVLAGFVTTNNSIQNSYQICIFLSIMIAMFLSVSFGLTEHWLSSIAYGKQIEKVEKFYTKKSTDFLPPKISVYVRMSQTLCLFTFVFGVLLLVLLATIMVKENVNGSTSSSIPSNTEAVSQPHPKSR